MERHLANWLPEFVGRVEQANALPIYAWASQTLNGFVAADFQFITS